MSIELLNQNIGREKQIITEVYSMAYKLAEEPASEAETSIINKSIDNLISQLKILNEALPDLIENVAFYPKMEEKTSKPLNTELVHVNYSEDKNKPITLAVKKKDEEKFLEHVSIWSFLSRKRKAKTEENHTGFDSYIRMSNKLFRNTSDKLVNAGYFNNIKTDLRRITSPLIVNSYASIMLFSFMLSFFVSLIFGLVLVLTRLVSATTFLGIIFVLPAIVFGTFFMYPSSKRKGLEKDINQELPFLTIYMSAISTSGIEPSKIFNILVMSKDYPFSQREIKKLTNYINFYGYDLVTSLKLAAKNCPSERLGLLFDGLATTITSGGELTNFLNKHSETLLFDYRLEREKYTRSAETFMNIYISIVIAAPMIMMMLFILMSLTGFGGGFLTPTNIGFLSVLVISLLNIGFIVFLNMKQPKF